MGPKTNRKIKGIVIGINAATTGFHIYTKVQTIKIKGTVMALRAEYLASCGERFSVNL